MYIGMSHHVMSDREVGEGEEVDVNGWSKVVGKSVIFLPVSPEVLLGGEPAKEL